MRRRDFLIVAGALTAAPRVGWPQRVYRVGTLVQGPETTWRGRIGALRAGLKERGYVEGRNLVILSRYNESGLDRLAGAAADLLREKPDVVVCGPVLAAAAMQKQDRNLPVVIGNGAGSVKIGLAKSFARPGGSVTGTETQTEELTAKHIQLLKTIAPKVSRIAVLGTGNFIFFEEAWRAARGAARTFKVELIDVRIATEGETSRIAAACAKGGCNGLYVMGDPLLINWRARIVEQAARLKLPAIYYQPEFVEDGGLASYSANIEDTWRRAAGYVERILNGAKPAEMPIELATRFELVINLKAARGLGLTVPSDVLARADRIIR